MQLMLPIVLLAMDFDAVKCYETYISHDKTVIVKIKFVSAYNYEIQI